MVLLTAVARNYDQNFITESPFWLIGPLLFSFVSGAWLFFVVFRCCVQKHLDGPSPPGVGQWRSFMGLFWMTAPIAWLYAIPVERFLDPMGAARANLTLLAIVSAWRVLLMGRVVSVVNSVPFLRGFAWVLIAAALEVIIVVFFGGLFGGAFSKRILAGMSGMRHAADERFLLDALGVSWTGAWIVLLVTLVMLGLFRYRGNTAPFPAVKPRRVPWWSLILLAAIWAIIAWPSQREQWRFRNHARLIAAGEYARAFDYLNRHARHDFPPSRRLEPNPYEYRVWKDLPPTMALLTTNTPGWIRDTYLSHLAATFQHYFVRYDSLTDVAAMYSAIGRLPEARAWLRANEAALARQDFRARGDLDKPSERQALTNIVQTLRGLGMSETNLARLEQ